MNVHAASEVVFLRGFKFGERMYVLVWRPCPGISNTKEFSKLATRVNKNQVHLYNRHKNYVLSTFLIEPNTAQN